MFQKLLRPARVMTLMTLLAGLLVVLVGLPAEAASKVAKQESLMAIKADGSIEVTSKYIFDGPAPAQLVQKFRLREEIADQREYRYTITGLHATEGVRAVGRATTDKDFTTVTMDTAGAQEVTLKYTVHGAAQQAPGDKTVVRWDVLQGLDAEVTEVVSEVAPDAQFTDFKCVAGPPQTNEACVLAEGMPHLTSVPTFSDGPRGPGEIVGLRMTFPASAIAADEEIHEQWTVGRAFSAEPLPLAAALAALLLGGGGLWLLHKRAGRDAAPSGEGVRVAEFAPAGQGVVEFKTEGVVLPGQVGTVADERVDPIDVIATIIDLAVRGHLRIEELPRENDFAPTDWKLHRREGGSGELRAYEQDLLDALAPHDGEPVLASQLGEAVGAAVPQVQDHLYNDMVEQGWYERRPDATRNRWATWAVIAIVGAVAVTALLAAFTKFGLFGLALLALALGLAFIAQEMPARTPAGAQLVAGLATLRGELMTHATDQMPKGEEYRELSEVLPYAIVLGGSERWLQALADADDDDASDETDLDWYHGPEGWHLANLPESLKNFIATVAGNLFMR